MDETPVTAALDARRRRLLFRANHRGTRENDILLGGYVSARIADFSEAELVALEALLELPDPEVADWLTGRTPIPPHPQNALITAMREAALQRKHS
jgi:antitoxin CptB